MATCPAEKFHSVRIFAATKSIGNSLVKNTDCLITTNNSLVITKTCLIKIAHELPRVLHLFDLCIKVPTHIQNSYIHLPMQAYSHAQIVKLMFMYSMHDILNKTCPHKLCRSHLLKHILFYLIILKYLHILIKCYRS